MAMADAIRFDAERRNLPVRFVELPDGNRMTPRERHESIVRTKAQKARVAIACGNIASAF